MVIGQQMVIGQMDRCVLGRRGDEAVRVQPPLVCPTHAVCLCELYYGETTSGFAVCETEPVQVSQVAKLNRWSLAGRKAESARFCNSCG